MLSFVHIDHADQVQQIITKYPIENFCWIVSDLKSKQDLQKLCIEKNNYYSDENILRISDFWSMWLRRLSPHIQVLSSEFIKAYIQQFAEKNTELDIKPHEVPTLHYYIQQLAPLLLSSNHESLMEWFVENKYNNNDHKWFKWYIKSKFVLAQILKENMLDSKWISSYLQNLSLEKIKVEHPIVLDLGTEMTSVEMGIFNQISKSCDIYVIVPRPSWGTKYHFLLNTYKVNEGFSQIKSEQNAQIAVENKHNPMLSPELFVRLSTQLAEVKWVTQIVRGWLDKGIKPFQIGLMSPQVEKYWPSLALHFATEGIPVDKPLVTSLISTGFFQNLIAELQSYSSSLTWEDLETSYFHNIDSQTDHKNKIGYEKFKALFLELTEVDDLGREESIKNLFYRKIDLHMILSRFEFLAKIIAVISQKNLHISTETADFHDVQNLLEIIFKDFLNQTADIRMKFMDWFELFKSTLAKKEIKISNSASDSVQIRNLGAVYMNQITHRIWFGLDDSAFQNATKNLIPLKDIEVLKNTFDFPLQYPEESHDEFNLRWHSSSACMEQFFSCAHVSLSGEPLNASSFILEHNADPDHFFHPNTRLDQLQNSFQAPVDQKLFNEKFAKINVTPNIVAEFKPTELSGTDVVNYAQCEFKLLASRGFRLRDYSVVSIDLDPMQKGTLAHELFDFLIQDELYKSVKESQIASFLDHKRLTQRLYPNDDLFWSIQKSKFIQTGLKFVANEKLRLNGQAFLHITEKDYSIKVSDVAVKVRIDRIDQDVATDEYLIYDYKRTNSQKTSNIDKWLPQKEYQMLFYLLALSEELGGMNQIRGAVYYFYQKLQVNKGFVRTGNAKFDSTVNIKEKAILTLAESTNLINDFKNTLAELFLKLQKSQFTANPDDQDICQTCDWRRLCRAQHLN